MPDPLAEPIVPPDDAPPDGEDVAVPVTRPILESFLNKKSTQARIKQVVAARVKRETATREVDDLVQRANMRAMMAKALPDRADRLRPWVSTLAAFTVIDHYRAEAKEAEEMAEVIGLEDVPPDEAVSEESFDVRGLDPDDPAFADSGKSLGGGTLTHWLETVVTSKADRLTLEMIQWKAKMGLQNATLAAEFGMTEAAYDNRLLRFKSKWVPAWKREKARRLRIALLLLGILLLLAAVALARIVRPRARPTAPPSIVEPPVLPLPSATSTDAPPRFDPALPPEEPPEKK